MTNLGVEVPQSTLTQLERRVVRLSALVEQATQISPHKKVREGGALLMERLGEWIDEIKELSDIGDADVHDRIRSFSLRLKLAEEKVKTWPVPARYKKAGDTKARPKRRLNRAA